MTAPQRVYNVVPSDKKPTDRRTRLTAPKPLPPRMDLREQGIVPEVWDQGPIGSCTGHGGGAAHEIERRRQKFTPRTPSRLALYYFERELEGDINDDAGAQIRTCIKAMNQVGVPREELWPYDVTKFRDKPAPAAYMDAGDHQLVSSSWLDETPEAICAALADGRPVVFGFTVFESFESAETARTGVVPMPAKGEKSLGGHCVAAVGFEITDAGTPRTGPFAWLLNAVLGPPKLDGYLLVRNSWSAGWGLQGYFKLPFAFVRKYVFDPATIDAVEA